MRHGRAFVFSATRRHILSTERVWTVSSVSAKYYRAMMEIYCAGSCLNGNGPESGGYEE